MRDPMGRSTFSAGVLAIVAGFVALSFVIGPGPRSAQIDLPPFVMIRETTTNASSATFEMMWEHDRRWQETLLATDQPAPASVPADRADAYVDIGRSHGVRDGRVFSSTYGVIREEREGAFITIPGLWFRPAELLLNYHAFRGGELIDDGYEITLRVTDHISTEEWVADKATGIPVAYRTYAPSGVLSTEMRATSIVLMTGEVIR